MLLGFQSFGLIVTDFGNSLGNGELGIVNSKPLYIISYDFFMGINSRRVKPHTPTYQIIR